jgi:hypothetical protein
MRYLLVTLVLFLFAFRPQDPASKSTFDNPPGVIAYEQNEFMDEAWVSNADYKEFIHYMKFEGANVKPLLPDSTIFLKLAYNNLPQKKWLMEHYYQDQANYELPVVGISKENRIKYATWRGRAVTAYRRKHGGTKFNGRVVTPFPTGYDSVQYTHAACYEFNKAEAAGLKFKKCLYTVMGVKKPKAYDIRPEMGNHDSNEYQLSFVEKCENNYKPGESEALINTSFVIFRCSARYVAAKAN